MSECKIKWTDESDSFRTVIDVKSDDPGRATIDLEVLSKMSLRGAALAFGRLWDYARGYHVEIAAIDRPIGADSETPAT
jgi:hypothetical protein